MNVFAEHYSARHRFVHHDQVLLSSNHLDVGLASRVLFFADGGIYEQGTPTELFDHPQKNIVPLKLSVSYAESDGATWITIDCGGAVFNPFEQENDGLGVTILKRMARHLDYRVEGGRNVVNIVL